MINSRASYDFVTFPDGVAVNGGIMPLRSGSAVNALRLEDVGFLYEAMCERQAVIGETANRITLSKSVRAEPLAAVASGLASLATSFMPDFEPTKVAVDGLTGHTIASVYDVASTSPTALFATGAPLVAANVKNLFGSVATMRQFEAEGEKTVTNTGSTHTYTYGPDERFDVQSKYGFDLPRTNLRLYAACAWSERGEYVDGAWQKDVDGGYEYEICATSGTYKVAAEVDEKYVDSVSVVAIMRAYTVITAFGETEKRTYYDYAIPVKATYADGAISVAFSEMLAAADNIATDLGLLRPGYISRQYNYYSWCTLVYDLLALCKLGERTKF